ncbi:PTS sugar transporter subunit IIA [Vagococcus silagei]|uniref:PTS sugar transporter subunit IIA n=1 Tax=Vagococcus silagei TaxID=2508885 RepID=A0A4S3B8B6_9ENTE|nr:PTS sugar transporter subunit IIA [Vagococcus silagei]THB62380.1 PTS sugar transporter subunit IIA [Vagococcus silagei]
MINCIVTGHGEFSVGLTHALEMIAGPQANMVALPFREEDPLETYVDNMANLKTKLTEDSDTLFIFTDLLGGTPFNQAMLLKGDNPNISVIAGTNLPMLLEFMGQNLMGTTPAEILTQIIESAKTGMVVGELKAAEEVDEVDGI